MVYLVVCGITDLHVVGLNSNVSWFLSDVSSIIKEFSDSVVVQTLHCKPAGYGFESSSYLWLWDSESHS